MKNSNEKSLTIDPAHFEMALLLVISLELEIRNKFRSYTDINSAANQFIGMSFIEYPHLKESLKSRKPIEELLRSF